VSWKRNLVAHRYYFFKIVLDTGFIISEDCTMMFREEKVQKFTLPEKEVSVKLKTIILLVLFIGICLTSFCAEPVLGANTDQTAFTSAAMVQVSPVDLISPVMILREMPTDGTAYSVLNGNIKDQHARCTMNFGDSFPVSHTGFV
jgi:hypothetical protein